MVLHEKPCLIPIVVICSCSNLRITMVWSSGVLILKVSTVDYNTRTKASFTGLHGLGLALFCFVVYSTRRFVVCFSLCRFVIVFFGPFGVVIASLGEGVCRGGGWSWCFSCVCSVCACLGLSVSSSSWGLGGAAVCDCGTLWTFLLPFLHFCWGNKLCVSQYIFAKNQYDILCSGRIYAAPCKVVLALLVDSF